MDAAARRLLPFCASDELPEGGLLSRRLGELPVAVARLGGRLLAFGALCPHQKADLAEGWLEEGGVTCPEHLWHFELAGGTCTNMPGVSIPLYAAREQDGQVLVELPA